MTGMMRNPVQEHGGIAARRRLVRRAGMAGVIALAVAVGGCAGKHKVKTTPTVGQRVPILSRIEAGTKVDTAISGMQVVLPPAEVNTEWAQGGGTASKSYGHLALGATPQRLWSANIAGSSVKQRLAASPVIGDGKLFVMDTEGMVRAMDANTGKELWRAGFKLPENGGSVFGGGASYNEGRVYVTTGLGEVAALDAKDGAIKWRVKPAGPLRGSPTVSFGAVYVMTQDNQIVALNIEDGALLWNESASVAQTGVFGVAAPAAGQGTIVAGYSSGELVAYRYENGRQLWSDALARTSIATSVSTLTDIDADPIIERGRVYALGQGGRMAAYELVTGQRVGTQPRGHFHPGHRRRMDLHADRRSQAAVHRQGHRQGALADPAAPLGQREEEDQPDLLDRPGAGGRSPVGRQFARRSVHPVGHRRNGERMGQGFRRGIAAAGGRQPDALYPRQQWPDHGVSLIGREAGAGRPLRFAHA
jgi:hypothetical protein